MIGCRERHTEAVLNGAYPEALGEVGFADTRRPEEERVLFAFGELAGRQEVDLVLVQAALEAEVVLLEGLGEAQAAELQSRLDAPLLTSLALLLKDVLEEVLEAVLLANALLEEFGEPLGRELEAQGAQQRSAAIEARSDAHRARLSRFS